jgi:branched-chain amino acid transport system permease protein
VFVSSLIGGIVIGSLYALMALGSSLVYGLLRILDIANIAGLVLAAYVGQDVYHATHSWVVGLGAGVGAASALGFLLQRLLYRPLLGRSPIVPLIASVGVFIAFKELFRLIWGPYQLSFAADVGLPSFHIGATLVTGVQLLIVGIGMVVLVATWAFINYTRIGLTWRAVAQDQQTSAAMGIRTNVVTAIVFLTGYGLAAVAGVFLAINYNSVTPSMGDIPAYKVLAIIVLGGLGSPLGTIAASLVIGLAETFVASYWGFVLPRDTIAFILLILILLVRPQGLIPAEPARA